ncbi:hypothetical protein ABEB36_015710 [Hypothenemus hampei]|uniref:Uncharacterized protein n=1 Tax=Hypothenemus hampei TaxID=57062 RepID=A0ABD1DZV4_HYPHA
MNPDLVYMEMTGVLLFNIPVNILSLYIISKDIPEDSQSTNVSINCIVETQHESSQFSDIHEIDITFTDKVEPTENPAKVVLIQNKEQLGWPIKKKALRQKGVFRAIGDLKALHELVNKDQPVPSLNFENQEQNQCDLFGKSVTAQLKAMAYNRALRA